jgi:hypothetical protein
LLAANEKANGPLQSPSTAPAHGRPQAVPRGAWRLTVEGPKDPITGERQQIHRTVREPNTKAGAKVGGIELGKLVVEVDAQRVLPSSGITVGQLMECWVEHRRPGWEERSPGQPDATLVRIRNHITPKIGAVAVDQLRPVDVDNLYSTWRAGGMAESTVRRMHAIVHSALTQAVRWNLIVSNPADRVEPPKPPQGPSARSNPRTLSRLARGSCAGRLCLSRHAQLRRALP